MPPPLGVLGWLVARDVNRTFGGGGASIELLRRTFTARGFLDAAGHAVVVAVSRLTPGTNILAYCVALGWRLHGLPGSVVALLAASVPSSIVILAVSATLVRVEQYTVVQVVLAFGMLVAAALVLSSAWALVRPYLVQRSKARVALFSVAAAVLFLLDVTPVRILLIAAACGFAMPPQADVRPPA